MLLHIKAEPFHPVFAQIDLKDATIKIKGATQELAVKVGEGNCSYSEARTINYTLDRGELDEVREGDQVPVDVSLSFTWLYVQPGSGESAGQVVTPEKAIKGTAPGWSADSSDPDTCRPFACEIEITLAPSCAVVTSKTITLADFRWEKMDHNLREATIDVTGRCNIVAATDVDA